jgi:hypothetical protein
MTRILGHGQCNLVVVVQIVYSRDSRGICSFTRPSPETGSTTDFILGTNREVGDLGGCSPGGWHEGRGNRDELPSQIPRQRSQTPSRKVGQKESDRRP